MARGKCTFKQSDATKAMKSAIAAGLRIERVEIDRDGKIAKIISGVVNVAELRKQIESLLAATKPIPRETKRPEVSSVPS